MTSWIVCDIACVGISLLLCWIPLIGYGYSIFFSIHLFYVARKTYNFETFLHPLSSTHHFCQGSELMTFINEFRMIISCTSDYSERSTEWLLLKSGVEKTTCGTLWLMMREHEPSQFVHTLQFQSVPSVQKRPVAPLGVILEHALHNQIHTSLALVSTG